MPKRHTRVARTVFSYSHGGFDVNVDGQHRLAQLHRTLGLPLDGDSDCPWVPWRATAVEARAWASIITRGLRFIEASSDYVAFFAAWRDFLATCSGYWVRS